MRLGAVFPQAEFTRVDPDEIVMFVRRLEDAGYDHLLVYDHVLGADVRRGRGGPVPTTIRTRSSSLSFCSPTSPRVQPRVGDRCPRAAATPDCAGGEAGCHARPARAGRIRLGVGIGWNAVEYQALGIEFSDRAARMDEQIPLLRRLWTEPSIDHTGMSEVVDAAGIAPLPPGAVPIWIGCGTAGPPLAASGGSPTGGSLCHRYSPAAASNRRGSRCGPPPPKRVATPTRWASRAASGWLPTRWRGRPTASRWRDAGADAVAFNALRAGARWPDQHLDLLVAGGRSVR